METGATTHTTTSLIDVGLRREIGAGGPAGNVLG